jgi:hypothetical protein
MHELLNFKALSKNKQIKKPPKNNFQLLVFKPAPNPIPSFTIIFCQTLQKQPSKGQGGWGGAQALYLV